MAKFVRRDVIEAGETTCDRCKYFANSGSGSEIGMCHLYHQRPETETRSGADYGTAYRLRICLRDFRPAAEEERDEDS